MKLTARKVTHEFFDLDKIQRLYNSSFPINERRPLEALLDNTDSGEIIAFYDNSYFCGFACLLNTERICHIIYFAIEENLRSRGYGSAVLSAVAHAKSDKIIIVDIEDEDLGSDNNYQRMKRKQFYIKNGYRETSVRYTWRGEKYQILAFGGDVTESEFIAFWDEIEGKDERLGQY